MKFKKPKFWDYKEISWKSILLFPLSQIYQIFFWILKVFAKLKRHKKTTIPIICVGNIYLGGTGKTPVVREIFKIAKSFGKNPAFIKKHYDYLSDEIKMLEKTGKVYVNKKRHDGIFLSAKDNHDVAILDDGFQDFSIEPNFSILCFTYQKGMMRRVVVFLVFTLSPCFVYAREQHVLRAGSVDPNPTCTYWTDDGEERDDGVCTPNKHCQPPTRAVYFGWYVIESPSPTLFFL